ncbi:hypothetical protein [uncultured Methylobacterium sp.]|uniref:hypothetical protein n=1 Tax=uncultured Methylobacterium sp. TaxID=157278 RepID=UPI0035CBBEA3
MLRARLAHWRSVRPLPVVTVAALLRGGAVAVLLAAAALPARGLLQEAEWITRPAACPRLDRWTGDCVYTARADGLTLERAAAALGRPSADLIATNPDVPAVRPLRRGAQIAIPPRPLLKIAR